MKKNSVWVVESKLATYKNVYETWEPCHIMANPIFLLKKLGQEKVRELRSTLSPVKYRLTRYEAVQPKASKRKGGV